MSKYVRVRDKQSGHELSVIASAAGDGYEVLDEPATARNGVPLPPKHNTGKSKPVATKEKPGRQADTTEENN